MSEKIKEIEEFLKNNLPNYETELTFELHQIKIMMFDYSNSQQKEIDELKESNNKTLSAWENNELENAKLIEQNTKLKGVIKEVVKDGIPSESNIHFTVLNGHYYFNKLKQLLTNKD